LDLFSVEADQVFIIRETDRQERRGTVEGRKKKKKRKM